MMSQKLRDLIIKVLKKKIVKKKEQIDLNIKEQNFKVIDQEAKKDLKARFRAWKGLKVAV